jgi:hypothetical protein
VDGSEKKRVSSPTKGFSFAAKLEKGRRRRRTRNNQSHFRNVLLLILTSFLKFIKILHCFLKHF